MSVSERVKLPYRSLLEFIALLTAAAIAIAIASDGVAQTASVNVRELGPAQSVSSTTFGLILQIHAFADGRVLVNDGGARRLVLLNKSLGEESIVLDSAGGGANYYGPRATTIVRYSGDSALFVDGQSTSLLLISPAGKVSRTISPPKPSDLRWLSTSASGVDSRGLLVYRGGPPRTKKTPAIALTREELLRHDSIPIVRANFDTRVVDTVANLVLPADRIIDLFPANGKPGATVLHKPPMLFDEWCVTSDGLIAIVRGSTYRFELFDASNQQVVNAKLPFDWRAITEIEKKHYLDSAKAAFDSSVARRAAATTTIGRGGIGIELRSPTQAGLQDTHIWITPAEMPSYWPSIRQGSVSADLDGNVWILPASSSLASSGVLVYDVVNNKGVLTSRIRLPVGRVIAGFGRGGMVYTSLKQETGGWMLEARSIK